MKRLLERYSFIGLFLAFLWELAPAWAGGGASVPGPVSEVRTLQGRPTFFVDGQPFTSPLFATYVPTENYYRQMAGIGCKVFNFQTNCSSCDIGFSQPTWKGPDQWDFSQMDERAHAILKAAPDGLILPRIYIGTPEWWWKAHPQEMIVLDHGGSVYKEPCNRFMNVWVRPYPSLASKKWREDMGNALRRTIEHIQSSDWGKHVLGYEIAALGSEEWYHMTVNQQQLGDYSPHMRAAFQQWLKEKYKTSGHLSKAWNKPNVDFEQVAIPSKQERMGNPQCTFRNPATEMNVIDFYQFYSDIVADTIDYYAGVAKEASGRKKVIGAFYDYMYEFRGGPEFGHNGGARIMRSRNIDFVCAPPSYHQRQLGSGAECYRRPFLPGTLHNKLWFHDNDLASFLFEKVMSRHKMPASDIKRHIEILAVTPTARESIWLYQRSAGFVVCEGIYESYFDLHGGYFDHPRLLQALTGTTRMLDQAKDRDRSSMAEILVLADEASLAYGPFQSDYPPNPLCNRVNQALLDHQLGFIKSGAPFDSGLLSDIDLIDFSRYKMVVFLNTWQVDDATRRKIDERIKGKGRTLVWCYAPGLFSGNRESAKLMELLTGITIVPAKSEEWIEPTVVLSEAGQKWLQGQGEQPLKVPFGLPGKICKLFSVEDPKADPLGRLAAGENVAMARKAMDGWTSVYCLTSVMPPELVRALARSAGVHIFNSGNDTLYANKSYLALNGASAGNRTIHLPFVADVYDALTEDLLFRDVTQFETSLMSGETEIYRYAKSN